jgi:hypothetical protein
LATVAGWKLPAFSYLGDGVNAATMKRICVVMFALMLLAGCKKDKGPEAFYGLPLLKSIHLRLENGGQPEYCSFRNFFYEDEKLSTILVKDSTYANGAWHTSAYEQTYTYNDAGKLAQMTTQLYTHLFIYDSGNRLIRRIRTLNGVGTDTIHFSYSKGKVVGSWRYDKKEVYYYFSEELDKIECWDTAPYALLSSVNYRYTTSRIDKASFQLFNSFDLLMKADFTTGSSSYDLYWYHLFESSSVTATYLLSGLPGVTNHFSRKYDRYTYPTALLMDGKPVCFYRYY